MKPIQFLLCLVFLQVSLSLSATTWDEPWHAEVVAEAESFVFAKIKSYDEEKGVKLQAVETLAGKKVAKTIEITNFYLLDLCSRSAGHGPEFHFSGAEESYFFLKKVKGKYCIATPTTGFAVLKQGNVYATYRHSYHQALVPKDIYQLTMTAIFRHLHQQAFEPAPIKAYVDAQLSKKPAAFTEEEVDVFFGQHVALESIHHLNLDGYYANLKPFLLDTANFHNQISAARALHTSNSDECKTLLVNVLEESRIDPFVKLMCVRTLAHFKPLQLKARLIALSKNASNEENGFGGNIMDPRVCTSLPSVKSALEELIDSL